MIAFILLGIAVGIQLLYLLIFSKTAFYMIPNAISESLPGVSVVVCAWNELENLRELIPILHAQQYETFEIIIVNDKSADGTFPFLKLECEAYERLRVIHIDHTPAHIASKKYALTRGIQAATHEIILLTDADCRPASPRWIQHMVSQLRADKEIVLGFSPYQQEPGFLNTFIQFETFYTALQYVSFALAGHPYMGVGRNLLYRKSLFLKHKGFNGFLNVLGGDDDLFINKAATASNTAVCLHPDSFTHSIPKQSWAAWFHQKRRHVSVGGHYKRRDQLLLGLLAFSHLACWVLFLGNFVYFLWERNTEMLAWTGGIFALRTLGVWYLWGRVNQRLGNRLSSGMIPVMDGLLTWYLLGMGFVSTFFKKKITWK
ncbi:glycosyl transferase family 2 [Siphonobacter curvatus]|uniref:Glycosyl transferase family 2 n=2 Tax=Siphonobacter curvatus TaxID=2094562 RepID=A0A2S7IED3_9BACT|nr:glycosyl transferase family 2 [Siphonobacter curvatus]